MTHSREATALWLLHCLPPPGFNAPNSDELSLQDQGPGFGVDVLPEEGSAP